MAKALIILGAGASYDYCSELRKESPLTSMLFSREYRKKLPFNYEELSPMFSYVNSRLKIGLNLEEILNELYHDGQPSENSAQQFIILLYYLKDLFRSLRFDSDNNYSALLYYLKELSAKAVFVNYNYDLFLESTLGICSHKEPRLSDYIQNEFPVIKIHGACNWYFSVPRDSFEGTNTEKRDITLLHRDSRKYLNMMASEANLEIIGGSVKDRNCIRRPAIALPFKDKNSYVCPDEHVQFLKKELNDVDRILIIGWSAHDSYILKLLSEVRKNVLPVVVIAGDSSQSTAVKSELRKYGISAVYASPVTGFSGFINSQEVEKFLTKKIYDFF